MVKSRRMKWAGHVACMEGRRMHIGTCGKTKRKEPLKDLDVDGRII
jgi:hypothetical protein